MRSKVLVGLVRIVVALLPLAVLLYLLDLVKVQPGGFVDWLGAQPSNLTVGWSLAVLGMLFLFKELCFWGLRISEWLLNKMFPEQADEEEDDRKETYGT